MNVFEKLQNARVNLQLLNLKKSGNNKFSGFTYYELADFLPAINKIFSELKLFSNFSIKENRAYLEIFNSENPEEKTIFEMPTAELLLKGCTAVQALGGVNTYCKRYLYLNALEIVENDLLDSLAGKKLAESKPASPSQKVNNDLKIYEALGACSSVEDVNLIWTKFNKQVQNKEEFINMCKQRKGAILAQGENNE